MNKQYNQYLQQYIGQEKIKTNLIFLIAAAKHRKKVLPHILFIGPSGFGKTTLAKIVAEMTGEKIYILNGANLKKPADLICCLNQIETKQLIFIDEIHSINSQIAEMLYSIMTNNYVNLIIGKEFNTRNLKITIPQFTLLGATTTFERLNKPFINRFPIIFYLDNYSWRDIAKIMALQFKKYKISMTTDSLQYLTYFTKLNPRTAVNLTKRIRDYFLIKPQCSPSLVELKKAIHLFDINYFGLSNLELSYLKILANYTQAISLNTISHSLDYSAGCINTKIEPFLIQQRLIIINNKGRSLSAKGYQLIQNLKNKFSQFS